MKLTRAKLTRLIKEELGGFLNEQPQHPGKTLGDYWGERSPEEKEREAGELQKGVERNMAKLHWQQYMHLFPSGKKGIKGTPFNASEIFTDKLLTKLGYEFKDDEGAEGGGFYYDPRGGTIGSESTWNDVLAIDEEGVY